MKSKIGYLSITFLTLSAFFLSCNDNDVNGPTYDLAGKDYVSFLSTSQSFEVLEEESVNVYLGHANKSMTDTEANVFITDFGENTEGLFTLKSSSFSFGNEQLIPVKVFFDLEKLEFNYKYQITLTLADDPNLYPLKSDIKKTVVTIKRGLTYSEFGEGTFNSEAMDSIWTPSILLADQAEIYRLPDLYKKGYPVNILINKDGTVTVEEQAAWVSDYGTVYIVGDGIKKDKTITMYLEHFVPDEGSFGVFEEILILP